MEHLLRNSRSLGLREWPEGAGGAEGGEPSNEKVKLFIRGALFFMSTNLPKAHGGTHQFKITTVASSSNEQQILYGGLISLANDGARRGRCPRCRRYGSNLFLASGGIDSSMVPPSCSECAHH